MRSPRVLLKLNFAFQFSLSIKYSKKLNNNDSLEHITDSKEMMKMGWLEMIIQWRPLYIVKSGNCTYDLCRNLHRLTNSSFCDHFTGRSENTLHTLISSEVTKIYLTSDFLWCNLINNCFLFKD